VGIANLLRWLDLPAEAVWALGTSTPARIAGLAGVGTLAAGARPDLVLWNEDLTPAAVWVGGEEQEI
jgi:N-acetylglucosamine-6-phosphate deacetylase